METTSGVEVLSSQYLVFRLVEEDCAVRLLQVKEIIAYTPVTRVPGMPAVVLGVINLRGKVVPVVDPAMKFGLPPREVTKWSCIVIVEAQLEGQHAEVGLLADAVSQVLELPAQEVKPPPTFGSRVRAEYLEGLGQVEGGFVLLLDLDRLLAVEEIQGVALATQQGAEPQAGQAGR